MVGSFLSFALTLLVQFAHSAAQNRAGYSGVYLGQIRSELPSTLQCGPLDQCEGDVDGTWVELMLDEGRVAEIDVVYRGQATVANRPISNPVTLAQAIKAHSLQNGLLPPKVGIAKDIHDKAYGVVDIPNRIIYDLKGEPVNPDAAVWTVSYVGPSAPAIDDAKANPLSPATVLKLLNAARWVSNPGSAPRLETQPSVGELRPQAVGPSLVDEASRKLATQHGMLLRVIAVEDQLVSWYQIDPDHPSAERLRTELCTKKPQLLALLSETLNWLKEHSQDLSRADPDKIIASKVAEDSSLLRKFEDKFSELQGMGLNCEQ